MDEGDRPEMVIVCRKCKLGMAIADYQSSATGWYSLKGVEKLLDDFFKRHEHEDSEYSLDLDLNPFRISFDPVGVEEGWTFEYVAEMIALAKAACLRE